MKCYQFISLVTLSFLSASCTSSPAGTFETPEAAVRGLADSGEDQEAAEELLGAGGFSLLRSGDDVADHEDLVALRGMIRERLEFEDVSPDCKIARLGTEQWELPIPLVRESGRWRFDVEAGREEVLNRRVGRNEISTIETLRELANAQAEYAAVGHDGEPPTYARRLVSSPGKHDGLYWPVATGEVESPMGPLLATAAAEGYRPDAAKPIPYHGYYFRVLTAQGASAPGGARSYLDAKERLKSGFAVLAWPATHGNSGVMTFIVNQQGIVFQRNLGADTAKLVAGIDAYDPDDSWAPAVD